MNQGLRIACLDNIESMENEKELLSEIHGLVQQALTTAVPDVLSDLDRTKEDLDYEEYKHKRNLNNGS